MRYRRTWVLRHSLTGNSLLPHTVSSFIVDLTTAGCPYEMKYIVGYTVLGENVHKEVLVNIYSTTNASFTFTTANPTNVTLNLSELVCVFIFMVPA